ncbi:MAG: redoxin domain-containing protein [Kofleriaceae bacterium]
MKLWLLALVGCATPAVPVSPDDPRAIFDQMAQHYAHARTCADLGSVELVGPGDKHQAVGYQLQFVRDDRWRLIYSAAQHHVFVLWVDAQHTYIKAPGEQRLDLGREHDKAITALSKASDGAATEVIDLLLGKATPPANLAWIGAPDPHVAHLRGADVHGAGIELTIDRDHAQLVSMIWTRPGTEARLHSGAVLDHDVAEIDLVRPELGTPPTWLGLRTEDAPARVAQVVPGAPADKAGVKIGDEVVSIDGAPIADAKAVVEHAAQLAPKRPAPLVVRRKGVEVPLTVTPELRPDVSAIQATFVGKPAPALSLPPLGGGAPITLAAGQVTVLDFWATWCGPCAILSPHLEDLTRKFPGLRVIGISDEDAADVAAYLARHKVTYTLALDPGDRATRDYLVQGLPTVIVIDKAGVVRYATVGVPTFSELDAAIAAAVR